MKSSWMGGMKISEVKKEAGKRGGTEGETEDKGGRKEGWRVAMMDALLSFRAP